LAQAEVLRLKLQRALQKKDERAVRLIEVLLPCAARTCLPPQFACAEVKPHVRQADLAELMEKNDLAFGSTNEEAEEEARRRV